MPWCIERPAPRRRRRYRRSEANIGCESNSWSLRADDDLTAPLVERRHGAKRGGESRRRRDGGETGRIGLAGLLRRPAGGERYCPRTSRVVIEEGRDVVNCRAHRLIG